MISPHKSTVNVLILHNICFFVIMQIPVHKLVRKHFLQLLILYNQLTV